MPFGINFQKREKDNLLKEAIYLAHDCANNPPSSSSRKPQNVLAVKGLKEKRKAGQGSMFWQFRHYETGDAPKTIDWKRTARGDNVIVRDRAEEQAETYRLWIDPILKEQKNKHDKALLYALSLSILIHENEDKTAPISKAKDTAKRGLKSLHEHLNYFQSIGQVTMEGLKKSTIPPSHSCLLFSDFWQPIDSLEDHLRPVIRQHPHGILIQIAEAEELAFPYIGRTFFKNFEDIEKIYRIEDASAVKEAYLQRIDEHQSKISAFAKRHGWRFLTVSPLETDLHNLRMIYEAILHLEEAPR